MLSSRKQKANEVRWRQSDLMSDFENLNMMLGSYQRDDCEIQIGNDESEIDPRSIGREESSNQNENDYRSYLNANPSENSCLTVETSRAISSEISTQMSRKFEEMQSSLNSLILDVINTAIETRVLPSIKNAVSRQNSAKNANLDLRSGGLHHSDAAQENSHLDLRSNRLHPENTSKSAQSDQNEFPRLVSLKCSEINHCRQNSEDSQRSDDEIGYDSHRSRTPNSCITRKFQSCNCNKKAVSLLYIGIGKTGRKKNS